MENKQIVIYVDGVFDIIHSGHFNAIRQAKKLGDKLYVGVNGDESVIKAKGPALMNNEERTYMVEACKWADKVITDTPYTPSIELLDQIGADYSAHGDDMAVDESGVDCYSEIKKAHRMKVFKRTEGVSTTDLIGRLLSIGLIKEGLEKEAQIYKPIASKFLTTGWRLKEFCNDKIPKPNQKVIYIDGVWDVLHPGIIHALELAKSKGDFLFVGIYDNETSSQIYGKYSPVLSLQERVFNILAIKYVDDVVIGSPRKINEDMIKSLGITQVIADESVIDSSLVGESDPYEIPKQLKIFDTIKAREAVTNDILIRRIVERKNEYIEKYQKKQKKEENYYLTQKEAMAEI